AVVDAADLVDRVRTREPAAPWQLHVPRVRVLERRKIRLEALTLGCATCSATAEYAGTPSRRLHRYRTGNRVRRESETGGLFSCRRRSRGRRQAVPRRDR